MLLGFELGKLILRFRQVVLCFADHRESTRFVEDDPLLGGGEVPSRGGRKGLRGRFAAGVEVEERLLIVEDDAEPGRYCLKLDE